MENKKIVILANKYPNSIEPTTNMFIQQLAWSFADMKYDCIVICPMPINFNIKYTSIPIKRVETNENGSKILVYSPKYISFGQSGKFLQKTRVRLTTFLYEKAVEKIILKIKEKIDFIYAYFLCPTGVTAAKLGKKFNIPAYMEHGEALYAGNEKYGNLYLNKVLKSLNGVIAVSNQNKDYLLDAGIIENDKIIVEPNCYREERFYYINKAEARKHFGWSEEKFIVGYAGSIDDRKGAKRIEKAIEKLENVYLAVAGIGDLIQENQKCILARPIMHNELVYFYNALDVFVLPTLAEGSCTATAEAIGCGCPIISSNRKFNENLCDENNSILVEPENIEEIEEAIKSLVKNKEKIKSMRDASLEKAKSLKQSERMKRVENFINSTKK